MLIRLLLIVVLFLWALLLPLPSRLALREEMPNDSWSSHLAKEEFSCLREVKATSKLSTLDPKRLNAQYALAQLRWQQLKFDEAAAIYKQIIDVKARVAQKKYDEQYVQAMLDLASVLRALNLLDEGQTYYESILHYDQSFLPINDRRIARDLNNLGISWYLKGSAQNDPTKRTLFMVKANMLLGEAEKIYATNLAYAQRQADVLDAQYLVLRDICQLKDAKLAKEKAASINKKLGRLGLVP